MNDDFYDKVPPPLLYRYQCRERALKFLEDPHLSLSDPRYFNDPFEFRPQIKLNKRSPGYVGILEHNQLSSKIPVHEAERILAHKIHDTASNRYHVFCLTEEPLDLLMWAHYGRSHTGCVFGFDSDLLTPFIDKGLAVGPVIYSQTRPVIEIPEERDDRGTIKGIFTKGIEWEYEREWRLALLTDTPARERQFTFPLGVLRLVIIGARCGEEYRRKIRIAVESNPQFKSVDILRATPRDTGYGLNLTWRDGAVCDLENYTDKFARRRELRRERGNTWYAEALRKKANKV